MRNELFADAPERRRRDADRTRDLVGAEDKGEFPKSVVRPVHEVEPDDLFVGGKAARGEVDVKVPHLLHPARLPSHVMSRSLHNSDCPTSRGDTCIAQTLPSSIRQIRD